MCCYVKKTFNIKHVKLYCLSSSTGVLQALLDTSVRSTLTTALAKAVLKAHVSTVWRRHFVSVQLGRWDLPVRKVSSGCVMS